jgi:hypothetical protein
MKKKAHKKRPKGRPKMAAGVKAVLKPIRFPPDCIRKVNARAKADKTDFSKAVIAIIREA